MSLMQKAVEIAVKLMPEKASDPLIGAQGAQGAQGVIGQPLSRLDGPLKVTGLARFTAEVPFDHLTHGALVCSTIAKGRITGIDSAAAERAPGFVAIMTHRNAPKMKPPPAMLEDQNGAAASNLPVMQDDTVRWNGQPVAIVVAESLEQAEHAASLVRVTYDADSPDLAFEHLLHQARTPGKIMRDDNTVEKGDAEAALRDAAVRFDAIYRTPRYNHTAIELHAIAAQWDGEDSLTLHDASQSLCASRYTLAKSLGLKEENIRILAPYVGGAFGNKGVWNHTLLCIAVAKIVGRPHRLVLSREDVFRVTGGRAITRQRVALGGNADGTLAALIHTGASGVVSHTKFPEQFSFPARHLYASDTLFIEQQLVDLDMVSNTSMRAPGESVGSFALESALDELALASGTDPIELRRRIEPEKDPSSGTAFSSRHLLEAFRRGAERFGWAERNRVPGSRRDGEWLVGQGVATAYYPYYRMPGAKARIRISADGRAVVQAAAHEMGMGTATVQTQHAAERLGLGVDRVSFDYGDTDLPSSPIAGGSSQSASIAAAIIAAHEKLVGELLKLAGTSSPLAGAKADEVRTRNGGVFLAHEPERGETYESLLRGAGRDQIECEGAAPMPLEMMQYSMHSYGAQFCEVRVSEVTGEVRVSRWLGSFDTGRILNPKTAASQFRGGIVMGIGMALTEETLFDERSGRIMNPSMAEYHVPVHADVPVIDVIWNDIPDPHSPLGLHGIGEIGITGVAAAIANALYNATGKRIRELPITLDKVLEASVG